MGLPRIFIQHPLKTGILLELEEAPAHHLTRVLRLDTGSEVSLFNGDGREYRSRLTRIGRGTAQVEVLDRSDPEQPPRLPIHLGLGLSKGERMDLAMDLAVQKSVELGVTAITPLITDRCVVRLPPQRMAKREEHWRGIIFSACGQSGRNLIPNLHPACSLEAWLKTVGKRGSRLWTGRRDCYWITAHLIPLISCRNHRRPALACWLDPKAACRTKSAQWRQTQDSPAFASDRGYCAPRRPRLQPSPRYRCCGGIFVDRKLLDQGSNKKQSPDGRKNQRGFDVARPGSIPWIFHGWPCHP